MEISLSRRDLHDNNAARFNQKELYITTEHSLQAHLMGSNHPSNTTARKLRFNVLGSIGGKLVHLIVSGP